MSKIPSTWNATAEVQQIVWDMIDASGVMQRLDRLEQNVRDLRQTTVTIEEKITVLLVKNTN